MEMAFLSEYANEVLKKTVFKVKMIPPGSNIKPENKKSKLSVTFHVLGIMSLF